MSWEWWERLTESKDVTEAREAEEKEQQLQELASGDTFKKMVKTAANEIIREREDIKEKLKREKIKAHQLKVEKAKEDIQTVSASMQESNEPFVNVIGMGFDKHQGLKTTLDWNPAFIRFLHKAGLKGNNDEATIRLWLANLWHEANQEAIADDYLMNGVDDNEMPKLNYDQMFEMDEDGNPIDDLDSDLESEPEEDWPRE